VAELSRPTLIRLLLALWRYLETGVVPEGAELKTDLRIRDQVGATADG
jgi:hypothetical protein